MSAMTDGRSIQVIRRTSGSNPMPIKPHKGESQSDFTARCVPEMIGTGPDKRPQEQAVAACLSIWRDAKGEKPPPSKMALKQDAPDPDDDESHDDYIDRCIDRMTGDDDTIDEADAEEACELAWEDFQDNFRRAGELVYKTHASGSGMEFVLSDGSVDLMGDVIEPRGWQIESFLANPIALFNHHADAPIGKWANIRISDNDLRGDLVLAEKGTSARINEIRKLVEADILRAASVGFHPIRREPIKNNSAWGGSHFLEQRLVEVSLVSVPANPNALAVAKSLNISPRMLRKVFGEHADNNIARRGYEPPRGESADKRSATEVAGEHAEPKRGEHGKGNHMLLSTRIEEAQKGVLALQDQLDKHLESIDDDSPTEEQMILTEDLSAKIETKQRHLGNLKNIEAKNAASAEDPAGLPVKRKEGEVRPPTDLVIRRKKPEPLDYFFRAAIVQAKSLVDRRSLDDTRRKIYGDDEATRVVCDAVLKAATAPAATTVTGWAAELVHTLWADFMAVLLPMSVYPQLAAKGLALTFGPNGRIIIPTRSLTPTIAGSFVGEGAAIPVRQGAFATQTLVPKKMAVITTWTREMDEHSTPAIEGLLRQAILQDTAVALDTVLLDTTAATTIRPAGLRSYQSAITASAVASNPYANFVADYTALYGALLTLTSGNVRSPTLLINPLQGLYLSMLQPPAAAAPLFPFSDMISGGRLLKADVIESSTVPTGVVIMVDAADFTTAGQEGPRLEISDQATLHMEDTTPADITIPGAPGTFSAPVKSMWQTDSLALRLIMMINWVMRRPVATWITGVTWK
jgi:HK97 family phage prohead protease/HK97 family phage major capsid protein